MTFQPGTGSGSWAWHRPWYVCTSIARGGVAELATESRNLMAVPSVGATNSGAAPLASAVPPPSIPDQKLRKPVVIDIKGSSAYGDIKNQKQSKAVTVKAPTLGEQVQVIFDDMKRQYNKWKHLGAELQNRGAWWGSQSPGDTKGAKDIPQNLTVKLKAIAMKHDWRLSYSRSGSLSFHKKFGNTDFIYHCRFGSP